MTREHIIPSFLYKFQTDSGLPSIGWNERANDVIGGEAKIADVCGDCNNGPLGNLDGYGKNFLIENGFLTQSFFKTKTDINYDYNMLLRWVMKISYNAAVAGGEPYSSVFNDYRKFILEGVDIPDKSEVMMFFGITSPVKLNGKLEEFSNIEVSDDNLCAPFYVRITSNIPDFLPKGIIMKGIYFGSLFIHIAILKNAKDSKSFFKRQVCKTAKIKYIDPNTSACHIETCGKNWIELYKKQAAIEYGTVGFEKLDKKLSNLKIPKKKSKN
ncbi:MULTISPECIES: hypothetical protein [unclassified Brenneria]|uniref:hypothetical protein n=1 Tax=unclassified Brenneria TaxID=2634434 RepID=UPI0029C57293|nr:MULTISPECIES: hypothetical protein [unclassified Brenneria]MDX5627942.1 hypothetical protein [Brenneria sp. L3-3Z]MDX5695038.1 hypothetical protein [Brenneria sp. L4-2C]